jgi:hypothetical protein
MLFSILLKPPGWSVEAGERRYPWTVFTGPLSLSVDALAPMMAKGMHVYLAILHILAAESDFGIQSLSTC